MGAKKEVCEAAAAIAMELLRSVAVQRELRFTACGKASRGMIV
jgi:hypothetical protein